MSEETLTIKPYLKAPAGGDPYLEGQKCSACGAISLRKRMACAKCGARDTVEAVKLGNTGKLHSFSIIYRAFPGIDVPFVSAIADLDGGGTIKTNLVGIDPDPDKITLGMDVTVDFQTAPRKDAEGNEYLTFVLKPAA